MELLHAVLSSPFHSIEDVFTTNKQEQNKIGDYYTSLTTDKRFILVDGLWDLRKRHTSDKIIVDSMEDDDMENIVDSEEEPIVEDEYNDYDSDDQNIDDDYDEPDNDDDDLADLVVLDEEDLN